MSKHVKSDYGPQEKYASDDDIFFQLLCNKKNKFFHPLNDEATQLIEGERKLNNNKSTHRM